MTARRLDDLQRFYAMLARLEALSGGKRRLSESSARSGWPRRGVYFFFEEGETRSDTGVGLRVVRVGTHALSAKSSTTVWHHLSQHRGVASTGGGNHRGSIFRLLVGTALIRAEPRLGVPTWGRGGTADAEVRAHEAELERRVSTVISNMPLLWLGVDDQPGRGSLRGTVERNAIALLSNQEKPALDPPSANWLGRLCDRERVRQSGLWNQNHVDEEYDTAFLDVLDGLIPQVTSTS